MNKKALLIVDVQVRLFQLKKAVRKPKKLLKCINILENRARSANATVVYIQHENPTTFKYGTSIWNLHPKLTPKNNDIFIRKTEYNSFLETPLDNILQEKKIDTIFVCGLLTNLCVMQTCLGSINHNYITYLVADAHSNNSIKPEILIKKINNKLIKSGVKLITTAEVVF